MIPSDPSLPPPEGFAFTGNFYRFTRTSSYKQPSDDPFLLSTNGTCWFIFAKRGRGMRYMADLGSVIRGGDFVDKGNNIILSFVGGRAKMRTFWFINADDLIVAELAPIG